MALRHQAALCVKGLHDLRFSNAAIVSHTSHLPESDVATLLVTHACCPSTVVSWDPREIEDVRGAQPTFSVDAQSKQFRLSNSESRTAPRDGYSRSTWRLMGPTWTSKVPRMMSI